MRFQRNAFLAFRDLMSGSYYVFSVGKIRNLCNNDNNDDHHNNMGRAIKRAGYRESGKMELLVFLLEDV